jgi:fimbrial chaperone protein
MALGTILFPVAAIAGSLRVGPTRIELSPQRPVAVLEVQNTGDFQTLAQLDTFLWTQDGRTDSLEPTTELIATPLVIALAPGETRSVRVGLRDTNHANVERSYRLFVREVTPTFAAQTGLQFALRIGVPVFAAPANAPPGAVVAPPGLGWRWVPDLQGCSTLQLSNSSARHDRVIRAELIDTSGEVLWESAEPEYVLAAAQRTLLHPVCPADMRRAGVLRLITEARTMTLPVTIPALMGENKVP